MRSSDIKAHTYPLNSSEWAQSHCHMQRNFFKLCVSHLWPKIAYVLWFLGKRFPSQAL